VVVTDHGEAGRRQVAGELTERRNAVDDLVAVERPTSTSAGGRAASPAGRVIVAARLKPLAGIMASRSPGLRTTSTRVITDATSCRATTIDADGTSSRASRRRLSTHSSSSVGARSFSIVIS
jgi:hypothetical protein